MLVKIAYQRLIIYFNLGLGECLEQWPPFSKKINKNLNNFFIVFDTAKQQLLYLPL